MSDRQGESVFDFIRAVAKEAGAEIVEVRLPTAANSHRYELVALRRRHVGEHTPNDPEHEYVASHSTLAGAVADLVWLIVDPPRRKAPTPIQSAKRQHIVAAIEAASPDTRIVACLDSGTGPVKIAQTEDIGFRDLYAIAGVLTKLAQDTNK